MVMKNAKQNVELVYLAVTFLWGLAAVCLQGWQVEISSVVMFGLAWRGFVIERELSPTIDIERRERQMSPRHGVYYDHELGCVFIVMMLLAAFQLVIILQRRV